MSHWTGFRGAVSAWETRPEQHPAAPNVCSGNPDRMLAAAGGWDDQLVAALKSQHRSTQRHMRRGRALMESQVSERKAISGKQISSHRVPYSVS